MQDSAFNIHCAVVGVFSRQELNFTVHTETNVRIRGVFRNDNILEKSGGTHSMVTFSCPGMD